MRVCLQSVKAFLRLIHEIRAIGCPVPLKQTIYCLSWRLFFLFMFIGSISKTDMLLKLQHLKYELDKDQKRKNRAHNCHSILFLFNLTSFQAIGDWSAWDCVWGQGAESTVMMRRRSANVSAVSLCSHQNSRGWQKQQAMMSNNAATATTSGWSGGWYFQGLKEFNQSMPIQLKSKATCARASLWWQSKHPEESALQLVRKARMLT